MEIANITIATLALIVAVSSIIISVRQAKKSDKISLMGLRIEFYNYLCDFINKYKLFKDIKLMISTKNAENLFGKTNKSRVVSFLFTALGTGDNFSEMFRTTCQRLNADTNYLDIKKYLFNSRCIDILQNYVDTLKNVQKYLSDCLNESNNETNLENSLESLGTCIFATEEELTQQIKQMISV